MAECEWAILCDYTFRDEAKKVCVIRIFDRIFAPHVPTTHHQVALVFHFVGDAHEKFTFRLEIVRRTGALLARSSMERRSWEIQVPPTSP
jgi:hypothetical protein